MSHCIHCLNRVPVGERCRCYWTTPRGFFGIVVVQCKTEHNIGGLWRSAHIFGAAFIAAIGPRYRRQPCDVTDASKHIPFFQWDTAEQMWSHFPQRCEAIAVERTDTARNLVGYGHPERAVYFFGPEDGSLPKALVERCRSVVRIPGAFCLNLASAGSIVMYDRIAKGWRR